MESVLAVRAGVKMVVMGLGLFVVRLGWLRYRSDGLIGVMRWVEK